MNITIIHGDHTTKSYEHYSQLLDKAKEKSFETVRIGSSVAETLKSSSLFREKRLFVIEEAKKLSKSDLSWIKKYSKTLDGSLLVYSTGSLGKLITNNFPNAKIDEFSIPKLIFKFTDSFYPGNTSKCLTMLHEIVENEPVEFLFAVLAKHVRDLYWVGVSDSTMHYPSWRISKLKNQATKFTEEKLAIMIQKLAEADILAKTSKTPLVSSLDMIIIKELE